LSQGIEQVPDGFINVLDVHNMHKTLKDIINENFEEQRRVLTYEANQKQVGGTHYKDMKLEPWDIADTWPIEQQIGVYRHGALKYIMRMGSKDDSLQEIDKAIHYLEKLKEVLSK